MNSLYWFVQKIKQRDSFKLKGLNEQKTSPFCSPVMSATPTKGYSEVVGVFVEKATIKWSHFFLLYKKLSTPALHAKKLNKNRKFDVTIRFNDVCTRNTRYMKHYFPGFRFEQQQSWFRSFIFSFIKHRFVSTAFSELMLQWNLQMNANWGRHQSEAVAQVDA